MESIKRGLSAVWKAWKKFGHLMGEVVGRVFLMVFYMTITLPFGLGMRLFGDPLDIRHKDKTPAWLERKPHEPTIKASYNQF